MAHYVLLCICAIALMPTKQACERICGVHAGYDEFAVSEKMIVFDAEKDKINRQKHGMGLEEAALADWNAALTRQDARKAYGEVRFISFVPIRGRLHCCIYIKRDGSKRIISLRKTNQREVKYYYENHEKNSDMAN